MSTFDWAAFFESVSVVDQALRAGSEFAAMDFATRLHACNSAVVHDVMKDLGLAVRVLPRTIVGLDHVQLAMPEGREEDADAFYRDLLGFAVVP